MNRPRTSHASRRDAGTKLVRDACAYLSDALDTEIVPRARTGKDRGDIHGLGIAGARIVVEAKNTVHLDLPGWAREAEVERINDGALVGVILHKRHGRSDPADQWVSMTLGEFVAMITLTRDHYRGPP